MHIGVIILNWNGINDTLECIASLKALNYPSYKIIVVDNGSTDDSLLQLKTHHPDLTLIENKKNLGFAEGNNQGIMHAIEQGFEALLVLNNDTVVDPNLLNAFAEAHHTHPKAILGAKPYLYTQNTHFDHFGGNWNAKKGTFDLIGYRQQEDHLTWEKPFAVDYVCGCALFATTEVFKTVGLFDARFFLFWEEADFCFRAKKLGYSSFIAPQAKIWHKVSASFVGGKPHTTYFWWRNRLLWIEKHLSIKEMRQLYHRVVFFEIFKLLRHYGLYALRYGFSRLSHSPKHTTYKEKLLQTQAALCGAIHYLFRRFYAGPEWLFKKNIIRY